MDGRIDYFFGIDRQPVMCLLQHSASPTIISQPTQDMVTGQIDLDWLIHTFEGLVCLNPDPSTITKDSDLLPSYGVPKMNCIVFIVAGNEDIFPIRRIDHAKKGVLRISS